MRRGPGLIRGAERDQAPIGLHSQPLAIASVRQGNAARVLATGVMGDKPGRHGDLTAWRLDHAKLVRREHRVAQRR